MPISIIVCHTQNRVIGMNGVMPWHLPRDLRRFREITLSHPVIMGRKTFEALPNKAPLPGRQNIVLSRNGLTAEGCDVIRSLSELVHTVAEEDCFVIGGEQIYKLFLSKAQYLYRTVLDTRCDGDAFFPEIDAREWKLEEQMCYAADEKNKYALRFEVLKRIVAR